MTTRDAPRGMSTPRLNPWAVVPLEEASCRAMGWAEGGESAAARHRILASEPRGVFCCIGMDREEDAGLLGAGLLDGSHRTGIHNERFMGLCERLVDQGRTSLF